MFKIGKCAAYYMLIVQKKILALLIKYKLLGQENQKA